MMFVIKTGDRYVSDDHFEGAYTKDLYKATIFRLKSDAIDALDVGKEEYEVEEDPEMKNLLKGEHIVKIEIKEKA